jgi:hypothetical protein
MCKRLIVDVYGPFGQLSINQRGASRAIDDSHMALELHGFQVVRRQLCHLEEYGYGSKGYHKHGNKAAFHGASPV